MLRGIARTRIFRDDTDRADRADCVARLAQAAEPGALTVYAWAFVPTHAHPLIRTGTRPLPRSLLSSSAGAFTRRHTRGGHLFQNRDTSRAVEATPYFLALVRYIPLNPLRAGVVPDLRSLARYSWAGHSALLGAVPQPWQDTQTIRGRFGSTPARRLLAYVWVEVLGRRASTLARVYGQTPGTVSLAAQRGALQARRWRAAIRGWCR